MWTHSLHEQKARRFPMVPPLAMGLVQPEWLFMYHYLLEPENEKASLPPSSPSHAADGSASKHSAIRINIRARRGDGSRLFRIP